MSEQTEEYVHYLDDLRASGRTNMFGAGPFLREEFGLTREDAHKVLTKWMKLDLKLPAPERAVQIDVALARPMSKKD